jgi:hypothetical protein
MTLLLAIAAAAALFGLPGCDSSSSIVKVETFPERTEQFRERLYGNCYVLTNRIPARRTLKDGTTIDYPIDYTAALECK